jgi:DNA-binding MarR family transcriptional regulator
MNQTAIPELIEKYWETIPPAWRVTRAVIRSIATEKYNLTVEQFQVLRRIRRGSTSVSALAEASQTSRSAVSKAVDVLVHKGLITRSQDLDDRRNIPLALTEEGQDTMAGIYDKTEKWLESLFSRLTVGELDILLRGMTLLNRIFSQD